MCLLVRVMHILVRRILRCSVLSVQFMAERAIDVVAASLSTSVRTVPRPCCLHCDVLLIATTNAALKLLSLLLRRLLLPLPRLLPPILLLLPPLLLQLLRLLPRDYSCCYSYLYS